MLKNKGVQTWARILHIYVSMALLLIVLFFVITGITLNRASWFVSDQPSVRLLALPVPRVMLDAEHNALIAFIQREGGLSGQASGFEVYRDSEDGELIEGEISFSFKGPGYNASVFIDLVSAQAEIEEQRFGVIAILNDLHKGRHSGAIWQAFIDVTALLMLGFIITGVCLLVPKKKSFITGLKWCGWGSLVSLLLYWLAVP